jgi:hypothetical protein
LSWGYARVHINPSINKIIVIKLFLDCNETSIDPITRRGGLVF